MAADEQTQPENSGEEKPLYSYAYELSGALVDEMATALAGDRYKNPATVACVFILAVIVFFAASPIGYNNQVPLVCLVVVWVILWTVSGKWQTIQVRKLRRAGLDPALAPEGKRRYEVAFYEDRVVVTPPEGKLVTYPVSSLRKPKQSRDLLVIPVAGGAYLPVPHRALSTGRYNELLHHVAKLTGAKVVG